MKSKLLAIIAITGGLSLAIAGPAQAATASHPKPHKTKHSSVTQVTGKQLSKALLSGSAFGVGDTTSEEADTGNKLLSGQALASVSSEPCGDLLIDLPVFGQTAIAENEVNTGDSLGAEQSISQFKNGGAARSFYRQEEAQYNSSSCVTYSTAIKGTQGTGTIDLSINVQSVSNIKVRGNAGFAVTQLAEASDSLGDITFTLNTTVVSDGTNVYTIWESNSASTPVPDSLLTSLISRTRALYKG